MNWLQEAFLEPTMVQAVIIISLVSALGLYLGRIKIFGISLGITFVFFAGILAGGRYRPRLRRLWLCLCPVIWQLPHQ